MLEIRFLGTFEVREGEYIVHFSRRRDQSLIAFLVMNRGVFHRREKLAALLWPDSDDEAGRVNLRHALWRMGKTLPSAAKKEYLLTDDLSIAFSGSVDIWFDVELMVSAKNLHNADELISVLEVYRGELLPGMTEEWVTLEREYIDSIYEHQMARLMSILHDEKRWLDILEWGERWISFGQRPEPAYRALMCAHKEMGEMSKVVDTYARCTRSLRELELDPSVQTRDLFETLVADMTEYHLKES